MTGSHVLLAVLALGTGLLLARGSTPWASVVLFGASLMVSSLLFLPGQQLRGLLGRQTVAHLARWANLTLLSLSDWVHLVAFIGLGLVLWLGRPDMRGWRAFALVALLAGATEIAQELAPARSPQWDDVALNLAGAAIGLLAGMAVSKKLHRSRVHQ